MMRGVAANLAPITAGGKGGVDNFYVSRMEGDGILRTVMMFALSGGLEVLVWK